MSHQSAAVLHGLPAWGVPLDRVRQVSKPLAKEARRQMDAAPTLSFSDACGDRMTLTLTPCLLASSRLCFHWVIILVRCARLNC